MFPRLASSLFIMSLLSLLGCSPRSTELPASLAGLHVEIAIEDITERGVGSSPYARKSITAVLRHARAGKIEREDVKVEVNGVPMEFRVGTGNYYDRHPYYRLADDAVVRVEPATEYRFTLVLPDGARHAVGTIRTPAALELAQIDFPDRRPKTGDCYRLARSRRARRARGLSIRYTQGERRNEGERSGQFERSGCIAPRNRRRLFSPENRSMEDPPGVSGVAGRTQPFGAWGRNSGSP